MFQRNISKKGRVARALTALAIFGVAAVTFRFSKLAGLLVAGAGLFVLLEALRGWCLLRACGIKTRL